MTESPASGVPVHRPFGLPAGMLERLRPGLRVLRRDATHLQIGLTPRSRSTPIDPDRLGPDWERHPALVSEASLSALSPRGLERELGLGLLATHRDAPGHRRKARATASIAIEGPTRWTESLARTLIAAGVGARVDEVGGPISRHEQVRVVIAAGEVDRGRFDELASQGTPGLPIAVIDGAVRVGPLVVSGLTACLRCLDAHHTGDDPRWPLLVDQYVGPDPRYGDEPLCDPAVRELVLAWAAHDLVGWLDGIAPKTWSQTWWFGSEVDEMGQVWQRHPHCGCTWADFLATG